MAGATAVVLVRPKGAGNIGAAARAMANFGFSRMRLVAPVADPLCNEALSMAVEAASIIRAAETFGTLEEALAGCRHRFATTLRTGRNRQAELAPADMGLMLTTASPADGAAIVFGPEDRGLSTDEIDLCNAIVSLETDSRFNSLNLAQAVLLMLYEAHRAFLGAAPPAASLAGRVDALVTSAEALLRASGFEAPADREQTGIRLRKLALRTAPTAREARLLHAALHHLEGFFKNK